MSLLTIAAKLEILHENNLKMILSNVDLKLSVEQIFNTRVEGQALLKIKQIVVILVLHWPPADKHSHVISFFFVALRCLVQKCVVLRLYQH